jgi:CRISPR-associated protein Csd2
MMDSDVSAARRLMPQKLIVFKHASMLGNAPAHKLFERVAVQRKSNVAVARAFSDYDVTVSKVDLTQGIDLMELL